MRAMIKVSDLTLRQWEWLQRNLKVEYDIPENDTRVCVQFEIVPEVGPAHREMSVRDFMALMARLQDVHRDAVVITGGYLPDQCKCGFRAPELGPHPMCPVHVGKRTCDHGSIQVAQKASMFEGAGPVRYYKDGCQSYGPYSTDPESVS